MTMTWDDVIDKLHELAKIHPGLLKREAMVNTGNMESGDPDVLKITGLMTAMECECSDGETIHAKDIVLDTQGY
jgi:hypothetical protein